MRFFLDTANLEDIKAINATGVLDGLTTNPSKMRQAIEAQKSKKFSFSTYIKSILKECKGIPVSLEVIGTTYEEMVKEGFSLYKQFNPVAKNVWIKVPINAKTKSSESTLDGIRAIHTLASKGIPINCTLVFTPEQALLAARAGATVVSPFAGRIDDLLRKTSKTKFKKSDYYPANGKTKGKVQIEDNGIISGVDLVAQCVQIIEIAGYSCEVLAASIRNTRQLRECALVGAQIATMNRSTFEDALSHPMTESGMKGFLKDVTPEYARVVRKR